MTHNWVDLHNRLNLAGIIGYPLETETSATLNQRWLEQHCSNVKAQTGKWIYGGYRWHAYTWGFEQAVSGDEAWERYRSKEQSTYLIFFEHSGHIFDCVGPRCPDLGILSDDLYVFPPDLHWTMIFTHEESTGIGPFYVENGVSGSGASKS